MPAWPATTKPGSTTSGAATLPGSPRKPTTSTEPTGATRPGTTRLLAAMAFPPNLDSGPPSTGECLKILLTSTEPWPRKTTRSAAPRSRRTRLPPVSNSSSALKYCDQFLIVSYFSHPDLIIVSRVIDHISYRAFIKFCVNFTNILCLFRVSHLCRPLEAFIYVHSRNKYIVIKKPSSHFSPPRFFITTHVACLSKSQTQGLCY